MNFYSLILIQLTIIYLLNCLTEIEGKTSVLPTKNTTTKINVTKSKKKFRPQKRTKILLFNTTKKPKESFETSNKTFINKQKLNTITKNTIQPRINNKTIIANNKISNGTKNMNLNKNLKKTHQSDRMVNITVRMSSNVGKLSIELKL
ncbi:unnamed protein product [Meloidogyne enterolobii]|uniref:Uncharacterized protein n=1 Tax=Meloidogyne enterolobii TaxID=390850 RepID=A0ACB0ZAE5_MELEN